MIGYDIKFAEKIQIAYGSHQDNRLNDESWRRRIIRAGAMMLKSRDAEMELEKHPDLWSCADPGDYFCRATGVVDATVILATKEIAFKIITLGLP